MARTGTITLYEGVGKTSKKPFTALKLEVGDWSALYFPNSKIDLGYLKEYLKEDTTSQIDDTIDLDKETPTPAAGEGLFDK